jgi:hypothetical protein
MQPIEIEGNEDKHLFAVFPAGSTPPIETYLLVWYDCSCDVQPALISLRPPRQMAATPSADVFRARVFGCD